MLVALPNLNLQLAIFTISFSERSTITSMAALIAMNHYPSLYYSTKVAYLLVHLFPDKSGI